MILTVNDWTVSISIFDKVSPLTIILKDCTQLYQWFVLLVDSFIRLLPNWLTRVALKQYNYILQCPHTIYRQWAQLVWILMCLELLSVCCSHCYHSIVSLFRNITFVHPYGASSIDGAAQVGLQILMDREKSTSHSPKWEPLRCCKSRSGISQCLFWATW